MISLWFFFLPCFQYGTSLGGWKGALGEIVQTIYQFTIFAIALFQVFYKNLRIKNALL
jgi:hypothetical protein